MRQSVRAAVTAWLVEFGHLTENHAGGRAVCRPPPEPAAIRRRRIDVFRSTADRNCPCRATRSEEHGTAHRRTAPEGAAHHAGAAPGGPDLPEGPRRQARARPWSSSASSATTTSPALLSKQYGVPSINLTQFDIDPSIVKLIPVETAQKYQIVPLSRVGRHADDRHDGPDERVRHGRHQVHDGLQHRAGRGVRDGGPGGDPEVLRGAEVDRAERPRGGLEGPRRHAAASSTPTSRCSRSSTRSASTRWPGRARRRRSSGWSTCC